jgi:hypothetical protein
MGKLAPPRAQQFALNLRELIRTHGLTQQQAADKIGVPLIWLRKACYDGFVGENAKNRERIELVRRFFDVSTASLLWSPSLKRKRAEAGTKTQEETLLTAIEQLTWAYRLNPVHSKVRLALKAIEEALAVVSDEDAGASLVCMFCGVELSTKEAKNQVCSDCRRRGEANYETRKSIYEGGMGKLSASSDDESGEDDETPSDVPYDNISDEIAISGNEFIYPADSGDEIGNEEDMYTVPRLVVKPAKTMAEILNERKQGHA